MSIKIKKLTGETFDLPSDFTVEGEKNNPLFSEKGSQTVPVSFPATPHNMALLDNACRLDRTEKPGQAIPVAIESGPAQQTGLMAINSASPSLISANVGFDEAELYSRMGETQLRDIRDLPSFTPAGATREDRVDALLVHLTSVMKEEVDADYYIFPVELRNDVRERTEELPEKIYSVILNSLNVKRDASNPPYGAVAPLAATEHCRLTWYMDNEEVYVDAMKGYGVSPFIKVYRVLELIFEKYFGCRVVENPFREHRQLKKLVVLNNVMDSILTGTLYYSDLMPDVTIKEFLDALYNKFGMLYYMNSNMKTVRLVFLRDLFSQSGHVNLNSLKTEEPSISYSPQKQLKITANRELKSRWFTAETLYGTFEEFLQAYHNEFTTFFDDTNIPEVTNVFMAADGIYLILEAIDTSDGERLASSDFFDWDKKTPGIEYEEITQNDLCLPINYPVFVDGIPNTTIKALYFGANMKHHYSNIVFRGETARDEENPAQIAFAFGWGITDFTGTYYFNWFFASQINRDIHGHWMYDSEGNKYDISLTINREDGLFNRFWKEYDAFLRHSNQEVKCNLRLSDVDLLNFDTSKIVQINQQRLLVEQIKFKLNQPDEVGEGIFRTLRLYEPYDLQAEQGIPVYVNQKYYWRPVQVNVPQPAWEPDWIEADELGPGFVTIDGVNYNTKMLFILPPTEEQYQNQETVQLIYHTVWHKEGQADVNVTSTVTYRPTVIVYP